MLPGASESALSLSKLRKSERLPQTSHATATFPRAVASCVAVPPQVVDWYTNDPALRARLQAWFLEHAKGVPPIDMKRVDEGGWRCHGLVDGLAGDAAFARRTHLSSLLSGSYKAFLSM